MIVSPDRFEFTNYMATIENSRSSIDLVLDSFYQQKAGEIGLDISEVKAIINQLDNGTLSDLLTGGWNLNEIKDLLDVVLNASDQVRIGVFGSMSRGKAGIVSSSTEKPEKEDLSIDILVVAGPSNPEPVSITEYRGSYSDRKIKRFLVKESFVEAMFGKSYRDIKWVYDSHRFQVIPSTDEDIYRLMYGR